jgi:hypothetical protein
VIALDVVKRLSAVESDVAKEHIILDAYSHNCFEFFEATVLAADPFVTFGVKKVAEILEDDGAVGSVSFTDFKNLCTGLQTRTLTGEAARRAICDAAERCHVNTWNLLYRRVLLKLPAIDVNILNQVISRLGADAERFRIPVFRCQLPTRTAKAPPAGPRLIDARLHGTRLFAALNRSVTFYTASGETFNTTALDQALQALAMRVPAPIMLDGVLTDTGYVLFDLIPLADFRFGASSKTQRVRRQMLEMLQRSGAFNETRLVRVLPQIEIDYETDEGRKSFFEFNKQALLHGYTEVVIKKPEAIYSGKRTAAWLIRKAEDTETNT